jgi:hypothetical protein
MSKRRPSPSIINSVNPQTSASTRSGEQPILLRLKSTVKAHTLALRKRIGKIKWCQLYSVEMQEAYLLLQLLMQQRKSP